MRTAVAGICLTLALTVSAANTNESVNELMQDLGNTMLRMLPAAYSKSPDQVLLLENLVRLEYMLDEAAPHFDKANDGGQVTLTLLQERLADARAYGTSGNPALLQTTLSEAFTLCASCHVQDRVERRAFAATAGQNLDDYLAGEYYFLTRNYDAASQSMQKYFAATSRTKNQDMSHQDSIVLQRMLTIGVEVQRDLAATATELSGALKHLDAADYNHGRVEDWISVLTRIGRGDTGLKSPIGLSMTELDEFLSRDWPDLRTSLNFSQQEAYWVIVRGELNRHLKLASGQKQLPKVYYWLAVADRELQYRFYGSLSRAYLEACVYEYPGDAYATRCLDEYELLVLISFSGSSGTFVPPEVNEKISEMRKLILDHSS
ncbi:MAG: hypothetical protein ACE37D_02085 [Pseudomonadales bacterium]